MNPAWLTPFTIFTLAILFWLNLKLNGRKVLKITVNAVAGLSAIIQVIASILLLTAKPPILGYDLNDYLRLWLNYPEYNLTVLAGMVSFSFLAMSALRKKLTAPFIRQNMATVLTVNLVLELRILTKAFINYLADPAFAIALNISYQVVHCGIVLAFVLMLQAGFLLITPSKQTLSGKNY